METCESCICYRMGGGGANEKSKDRADVHFEMADGMKRGLVGGLEELMIVSLYGTLCKYMVNTNLSE